MPSLLTKRLCSDSTPTSVSTPPPTSRSTTPTNHLHRLMSSSYTPPGQTAASGADDTSLSDGSTIPLKRKVLSTPSSSGHLKRKARTTPSSSSSSSSAGECWSQDRLLYEYQQLMQLRVQASGSIAEATKAHQNAVAANGRVVEQERVILAHVAKKAKSAYREKEHALAGYIEQYEKSKSDSLSAFQHKKASEKAERQWLAKAKGGGPIELSDSGPPPSVTDIMMAL